MSELIIAVCEKNYEAAMRLLLDGCNPNTVEDSFMLSPLHHAVVRNDKKMALLLGNFGANPFQLDIDLETPYHYAAVQEDRHEWFKIMRFIACLNFVKSYR